MEFYNILTSNEDRGPFDPVFTLKLSDFEMGQHIGKLKQNNVLYKALVGLRPVQIWYSSVQPTLGTIFWT